MELSTPLKSLGNTIKKLDVDVLGDAKNWISKWKMLLESELHVTIIGSPKLKFYNLDFGWGKPKKVEVSIDELQAQAISLCESRNVVGGIEIGLTLPKSKMDHFSALFNKGLNNLF
ncbi:Anthocyanin 5-aromatic acyltransferase [Forsythia ovata]|uniref:Anthocyanin 5-aromatic acyltransferase n=1 Tax=Forsythia ovata TaxID=205694 RepID=A0ABD1R676_9LAMI